MWGLITGSANQKAGIHRRRRIFIIYGEAQQRVGVVLSRHAETVEVNSGFMRLYSFIAE